jgi:hypothetical protein
MADAQLKLSRRTLLAAACAVPVLSAVEGPLAAAIPSVRFERSREAAPSEAEALLSAWSRALSRFPPAEAAVAALEGGPDEDAFDRALDHFNARLRALLATPAPHVEAHATKLDAAVAAELADMTYAPPALAALARDARRLALRLYAGRLS